MYKIKEIPVSERPRERLKNIGVDNLSNTELLSIILKSGTVNKNVTELATELLNSYTLSDLKNISINGLKNIKGIGEVKAMELLATIELGKRIFVQDEKILETYTNPKDIWEKTKYLFKDVKQEYLYALYFDNKQRLIEKKLLFIGTVNQSVVHPREIFKEAYRLSASSIICIHNHPSNDTTPSKQDIIFTENLFKIGAIQGIPILDHIIVSENKYFSFYEHKNNFNI